MIKLLMTFNISHRAKVSCPDMPKHVHTEDDVDTLLFQSASYLENEQRISRTQLPLHREWVFCANSAMQIDAKEVNSRPMKGESAIIAIRKVLNGWRNGRDSCKTTKRVNVFVGEARSQRNQRNHESFGKTRAFLFVRWNNKVEGR